LKTLKCSLIRPLTAGCLIAVALGLQRPRLAGADTIDEMVHNSGALESPFWSYHYKSGFGLLDSRFERCRYWYGTASARLQSALGRR
jgi:hypothetical protein